jgi:hypothetical protein
MNRTIPVSLYFTMEWWDRHYHYREPRPECKSQGALERMYLGRLRFLHREFGSLGIGEEKPILGRGQIATVIRHQFDLVPALLGTTVELQNAWGLYPRFRQLKEVSRLSPIDISLHPEGEWILREKERLERLYGGCIVNIDIGSVSNNSFRMLGESFYAALLEDKPALSDLFETVLETERYLYHFMCKHFADIDPVPLSNCNVPLMGPQTYKNSVLSFDSRQARFHQELRGGQVRAAVHHCDVPVDDFIDAYSEITGLFSLEASFDSNIQALKRKLPNCQFNAMVSPAKMLRDDGHAEDLLRQAIGAGADALQFWNIDPAVEPGRLQRMWTAVVETCAEIGISCRFTPLPLCWEEIEWAHGRYGTSYEWIA